MTRFANTLLSLSLVVTGCTGSISSSLGGGDDASGSDYSGGLPGSNGGSDGSGTTGSNGETGSDGTGPTNDPVYPTAHPRIYLGPNKARLTTALNANTAEATRFKGVVDAWVGGANQWGFNAWNAALMGQLTGDAKYCTAAIAAVDAQVTTAEATIASGNAPIVADDSYLYIGDDIGDLALVYDWCNASVSSSQKTRWLAYADQAVSNVWHPSTATWGGHSFPWSGWATDDPSDNYYYSFLRATMMLGLATKGEDTQADTWIDQFRMEKVYGQLDPTFDSDLVGGASREGTGYGVAMRRLWELYDWWNATTGESLATQTPHTRSSMLAFMHQTLPTLDRVAPTGDQARDSTASFFDYDRQYLQELMAIYPNDALSARAAYLIAHSSIPSMSEQFMAAYDFVYASAVTPKPMDMNTSYYASGIGQLYTRSGWDTHATWVNLTAGPYTESHAHQDQGSMLIYKDGWLAYDSDIDSNSGLRQETNAHGLVRIDRSGAAIKQVTGTTSKLAALQQGDGWVYAVADVTAAYGGDSGISKVQREMVYLQPNVVVVFDRVTSASGTQQTWQLASPVQPSISGATATFTNAGHTLTVQRLAPAGAVSSSFDYKSDASGDYKGGYRLDETITGGDQRFLHVMSIDGAATSTVATADNAVTVTLNDGRVAIVTFSHDSPGATLVLGGVSTTLSATVATLPQ